MKRTLAALLCLISTVLIAGCGKESSAIGIIGSADGPTAIYVTDNDTSKSVHSLELSQIDINSLREISEFRKAPEIRGYGGYDSETLDLNGLNLISPDACDTVCLLPGVSLTGFGLVDGKLHIQVKYEDILNTDNHGLVWLKGPYGSSVLCENSVSFWADNHSDSFDEYIFPSLEGSQVSYEVWGEFWTD